MPRKTTATIMLAAAVLMAGARAEPGLRFTARLKEGKPQTMVYRDVAAARKLTLVDHANVWARIQETDDALFRRYVPDGLHPGPEGCAAVITPAILKTLGLDAEPPPAGAPAAKDVE
jgi:hypothetical protein